MQGLGNNVLISPAEEIMLLRSIVYINVRRAVAASMLVREEKELGRSG